MSEALSADTLENLAQEVENLCQQAGEAILQVYNRSQGFDVDTKADDSPITEADLAAHRILDDALAALLPDAPVLSEESEVPSFAERRSWRRYWLVDPLDGTKEFINRNGEFTVNVALIEDGRPVLGVVHVPLLDITYTGLRDLGAVKRQQDRRHAIHVRSIASRQTQQLPLEIVASRRHGAEEVVELMSRLSEEMGPVQTKSMGSSLKLCLIAEGEADLYPRLAPTAEWDTAAAQAVVEAAGGLVVDPQFEPLRYNTKDTLLNPFFYVIGDQSVDWRRLLN